MLPKPPITPESPRLFQNNLLEWLSRCHPSVVIAIYLPLSTGLFWYGSAVATVSSVVVVLTSLIGMCCWTFVEYWLHRGIMHWVPDFPGSDKLHYWMHGIHHKWPNDPYRLVMPIPISLTLFSLFLVSFYLFMGSMAWSFQAGFTAGYVTYEFTHFWVHHGKSHGKIFRRLQRHHLSHHFRPGYYDLCFAVTLPLWDRLFHTSKLKTKSDMPNRSQPEDTWSSLVKGIHVERGGHE